METFMRPLEIDFFHKGTESVASLIKFADVSSTSVTIESWERSVTSRSTSELVRSQIAEYSTLIKRLGLTVSGWFTELAFWSWSFRFSNDTFRMSMVVITSADNSVALWYNGCGMQLRRASGSSSWETTSKWSECVAEVFLGNSQVATALSQICLDDGRAVLGQDTSVRQWLHT